MATIEVKVPDIGDYKDVPVIEVLVKPGDIVCAEQSLITLESDKATLDVPTPVAGTVKEIKVKLGDKISIGSLIVLLETGVAAVAAPLPQVPAANAPATAADPTRHVAAAGITPPKEAELTTTSAPVHIPTPTEIAVEVRGSQKAHATPSVRAFARSLYVDLTQMTGSGLKGRITQKDVQRYVKDKLTAAANTPAPATPAAIAGGKLDLLPWPKVEFSAFGTVERRPLSRIQKLSGANLTRNWVMIPHVTQFDSADITSLESLRQQLNHEQGKEGVKLTMLAFLINASVAALKKFPLFNASLDGSELVLKKYLNIGFAADTPNGLVVPVIRDADKKGVLEIAIETSALAKRARDSKLTAADMQGGCFTISSLGGIGGTAFTPIINAPEVAILGVSKSETQPRWNGKEFEPRLMLPLSLSYDHRVIDGAAAARFTSYLAALLADMRRALL